MSITPKESICNTKNLMSTFEDKFRSTANTDDPEVKKLLWMRSIQEPKQRDTVSSEKLKTPISNNGVKKYATKREQRSPSRNLSTQITKSNYNF